MSYRNTGPQPYDYGGNYRSSGYDQRDDRDYRDNRDDRDDRNDRNNEYYGSRAGKSQIGNDYADRRFAGYNKQVEEKVDYKYNIYSLVDEPWNRCCEAGKCGQFPGNEGIAKDHTTVRWD